MPKPAKPARYTVDRVGSPDPPEQEYYVLGLVYDVDSRVALAYLGNLYRRRGMETQAEECFAALHESQDAHRAFIEARTLRQNGKAKKRARDNLHA